MVSTVVVQSDGSRHKWVPEALCFASRWNDPVAEWAAHLPQLVMERMRRVIQDGFDFVLPLPPDCPVPVWPQNWPSFPSKICRTVLVSIPSWWGRQYCVSSPVLLIWIPRCIVSPHFLLQFLSLDHNKQDCFSDSPPQALWSCWYYIYYILYNRSFVVTPYTKALCQSSVLLIIVFVEASNNGGVVGKLLKVERTWTNAEI